MKIILSLLLLLIPNLVIAKEVYLIKFSGIINPAASKFIERGITKAEKFNAECVILQMDTPGGLMISMDEIVKKILNSTIPTVVFIAPKGARAASAGVFVSISADIVAMAPGTSIGAAHPVDVQGNMASDKITNAAAATIRAIAEKRKRNPVWAEKSVRESKAVTEEEALKLGIIDIIAENEGELLEKLDGREVKIEKIKRKLSTKNAQVKFVQMSKRERFLHTLGDPTIAYVLFLLGIMGLIYEFATPGFGFPGIVGGICLILALYAFDSITVSLAGLFLIVAGIIMFLIDIKAQTHGALIVGGIIALILGSLMLFSPQLPYFRISLAIIGFMVALTAGFFVFVLAKGLLAQTVAIKSGEERLIGMTGEARTDLAPEGRVYAAGEEWSAYTEEGQIAKGEKVEIVNIDGVKLKVKKIS